MAEVNLQSATQAAEVVGKLFRASVRSHTDAPEPSNQDSQGESDDPALLCEMVRSLGTRAHRAIKRRATETPNNVTCEIGELRERIDELQLHIDRFRRQHNLRLDDLQRWLNSLRQRVEGLQAQPQDEAQE
jgi:hypothetical protein